jgi:hypothetical protein
MSGETRMSTVYQEQTADGQESRLDKFVSCESVQTT